MYGIINRVSHPDQVTESHTWLVTGMASGTALGAAIAGSAVEHVSPSAGLAVSGGAMLFAALIVSMRQTVLRSREAQSPG